MLNQKLEELKEILMVTNNSEKIKAKDIAEYFNIKEDSTYSITRKFIKQCIEKFKLPVVADSGGYYMIQCKQDFDKYMQNLNSRIIEIDRRKTLISKNYKNGVCN